ncbi:pericentriolar material 1 protein-like isoform X3 [Ostrea edulis]|uniref:pericentriolar material 1 protein-like isoform X3 n=1 Tax=Ostrea edulis TaxID=37623 RepID=UPI0024AF8193|nr:pericentriolar material 1 protein-like isoform X3 [Ostrea edulis]
MATGGHHSFKTAATDPRPRASWQRTTSVSDKDDNISNHSNPLEHRQNNWDFSDWKPRAPIDNTKRRKKGNPEREREQSLCLDSPPPSEQIRHTPSTYPRTRITPSTPTSQRVALENLRQQLTFSDIDDQVSNDGEKNNERNMPSRRINIPNFMRQDVSRSSEELAVPRETESRRSRSVYTNSTRDERPSLDGSDGGQIVGRLMQIRDYIKQAKSMMDALNKSGSQTNGEDVGKLKKLLENLQEQEKAYLSLLQQLLSVKEDMGSFVDSVNQRDQTPRPESAEDVQSVDLDVQSETSEATTNLRYRLLANTEDVLYNQLNQGRSRPRIEDKLGMFDDEEEEEEEEEQDEGTSMVSDMENTMVQNTDNSSRQELEWEEPNFADLEEIAAGGDLEGIQALLLQERLLKKLKDQQEQMRALKGRQAALLAIQRDAEEKLAEARNWGNQASKGAQNIPVEIPVEVQNPGRHESSTDRSSRRNYVRNEFKEQNTDMVERQSNPEVEAAAAAASGALEDNKQQLQGKLRELQEKKLKMDSLLQELSSLRNERSDVITQLNNASVNAPRGAESLPPPSASSFTGHQSAGISTVAEADQTAVEAEELQNILEAREKLHKLQEVKERLNELRSLVQYYQTTTAAGEVPAVDERTAFQSMIEGYGQGIPAQNIVQQSQTSGGVEPQASTVSKSDEDNRSQSDSSEVESNLSSLGPWGDDPEIQEKVRKLKAAKEKLKQLQGIVSLVQHTPDAAEAIPDSITELAATLEEAQSQFTDQEDKNDQSEGEVPNGAERDSFYEAKMQEQLHELEQLRDERQKLLAIQQELQSLHDRFTVEREEAPEEDDTEVKTDKSRKAEDTVVTTTAPDEEVSSERTRTSVPVVTFSSNDEVYGKMRKQRMLREELRQKKRELEAIMKKDGSRKQYGKNQDSQSDTVSLTTDAFGVSASADATMATWGGSTVDNLESITEDDDRQQGPNMEDEDDGFPSDGIVQVEEEEEENDSDNNTYTIENDVRQRRQAREQQRKKIKSKQQTFPRSKEAKGARPKSYRGSRIKQENYTAPEDIIQDDEDNAPSMSSPGGGYENLQQQLERTANLCQNLLTNQSTSMMQPNLTTAGLGPRYPDPNALQQQLQQQQLMLTLNQCLQQITMQQLEMQNMQRQMQSLSLLFEPPELDPRLPALQAPLEELSRSRSQTSLPSGLDSRGLTPNASGGFHFQPRLSARSFRNRSNENLLLNEAAGGEDLTEVFASERPDAVEQNNVEQHRRGIRSKSSSVGQYSAERSLKRKTSSMSDRNRRQTSQAQQTSISENPDVEPPLNLQEILRRKKTQGQKTQSEWSTMSLASSKHESGMDGNPDLRTRGQRSYGAIDREYRPGLSAGISGAGFQLENSSIASTVSNRFQAEARALESQGLDSRFSTEQTDFSLFETLRESIYSEVATLISQNENRPHFLIELFRELQVLTTDYLRQRVLYSIRDIVSKHLTEQASANNSVLEAPPPAWMNATSLYNYTASELTPSESLMTDEDEDIEQVRARNVPTFRTGQSALARGQSIQNNPFDYEENADNDSSLSTPSNSYWDSPFAQDSLGDTVIHLDKALKRMKEYDKKIAEGEAKARALTQQRELREQAFGGEEPTSSSAVDQGSESSFSSMSYPKIDTQQLDQQIKGIMKEVIPVIKENMDSVCSTQLLAYIKRLVLSLARQGEATQYSRFFSSQMSSTLQDTLAKYEGRKMRQCGEDLLVDMSEALFNELAFFKLMEGLGEPASFSADEYCSTATQTPGFHDETEMNHLMKTDESDTTETVTDEDEETLNSSVRVNDKEEEEDLGKARDDELANEVRIQDSEEKDEDTESPYKTSPVQIELAPSETKPFTRIGSDEDDEDADESQSADDPSDTAVSHLMECSMEQDGTVEPEEDYVPDYNDDDQGARSETTTPQRDAPTPVKDTLTPVKDTLTPVKDTPTKEIPSKKAAENMQINGHMEEEIENEITEDDLPTGNLNISKEQIENNMNEEQQSNGDINAILSTMNGKEELAGDGQFLKEPPTA